MKYGLKDGKSYLWPRKKSKAYHLYFQVWSIFQDDNGFGKIYIQFLILFSIMEKIVFRILTKNKFLGYYFSNKGLFIFIYFKIELFSKIIRALSLLFKQPYSVIIANKFIFMDSSFRLMFVFPLSFCFVSHIYTYICMYYIILSKSFMKHDVDLPRQHSTN